MNLTCIICSDGITASSETYTTQCGHLFHYPCLIQWIERSKTCPQCRNKATEKTIHRIYLNLASSECQGDDIITLQNKFDNLQFQLMLKEKDLKNLTQKYDKVKHQNITLREEITELENKTRVHDSVVHALKDQISYFKSKTKERDRYAEELTKLKTRLKQMESVELLVNGSREEITDMLKNENDVESLVILVATLKKALLDTEKKKGNVEHKVKQLQNELAKYRKDITSLELSNKELLQKIDLMDKKTSLETDSSSNKIKIIHDRQSDISLEMGKGSADDFPLPSYSVEQNLAETSHLDLPYFSPRRNSDIEVYVKKNQNLMQARTGTKHVSIFKRPSVTLDKVKTCRTENLMYNGLGGQCKEDLFPSPQSTNTGIKRQRFDGCLPSSKLRKVSSVLPSSKMKNHNFT